MASRMVRVRCGRYDLVAAPMGQGALARAFLSGAAQGSGIVDEASGPTPEAALDALRAQLSERDRGRLATRGPFTGRPDLRVPHPDEYQDALRIVRPNEAQWAMLRAHAAAGSDGLTAGELARAAGWKDFESANLHYGLLGQAVAEAVGLRTPAEADSPRSVPTLALAYEGPRRPGTDHFVWVMHPELIEALASL